MVNFCKMLEVALLALIQLKYVISPLNKFCSARKFMLGYLNVFENMLSLFFFLKQKLVGKKLLPLYEFFKIFISVFAVE